MRSFWLGCGAVAIGVSAVLAVQRLARPKPEPCPPAVAVVAPVLPPVIAMAPTVAPVAAKPHCESYEYEESLPPAQWTIGPDHFGPFTPCVTVDRALVERVLPGHEIESITAELGTVLVAKRAGRKVLTITPTDPADQPRLDVTIHTRDLATPFGIRVGDTVETLRAHHRDLQCMYGAVEGEENLWCRRVSHGDGWQDTFLYSIDLRSIGTARRFLESDDLVDKIGHLKITAIRWDLPAS